MGGVKAETAEAGADAEQEEPDFGDEATADPPPREAPDYADVIDETGTKEEEPADDDEAPSGGGKPRGEVVHVMGAQRLGPANLLAVLALKDLPKFLRLEWVGEEEVLMVFDSAKEASTVLQSLRQGFDMVPDGAGGKDPGVWRARRGMLDFRKATADDVAPLGFKRQRRAGRQAKEFRLWAENQAVEISDGDEAEDPNKKAKKLGLKNWRDWRKRATRDEGGITDDEDIDLLEQMSKQDKAILNKEDGNHPAQSLWSTEGDRGKKRRRDEDGSWAKKKQNGWQDRSSWQAEGNDRQDRWNSSGRGKDSWRWNNSGSWDKADEDWNRPAKRRRGSAGGDGAAGEKEKGSSEKGGVEVDNEERERRRKRQERFQAQAAVAAS